MKVELVSHSSKDISREDFDGQRPLVLNLNVPIHQILDIDAPAGYDESHVKFDDTLLKIGPLLIPGRHKITITLLVNEGQQSTLERVSGTVLNVDLKGRRSAREGSFRSRLDKALPGMANVVGRTLLYSGSILLAGAALAAYFYSHKSPATGTAMPYTPSNFGSLPAISGPARPIDPSSSTTALPSSPTATQQYQAGPVLNGAGVNSIVFSPDGKTLAAGDTDNTVALWNPATRQKISTFTGHAAPVTSVAFSTDGKTLAAGSQDNTVVLWSTVDGQKINTFKGTDKVDAVALSPDGKTLAAGIDDNTVILWQVGTGQITRTLTGHSDSVDAIAFSPDGQTLASGSSDKSVVVWNVASGQKISTLTGFTEAVNGVAFSPVAQTLAAGGTDGAIRFWTLG